MVAAKSSISWALTGVAIDPSGAVVTNVKVEIKDDSRGTIQSMKTDREGVLQFFFLAPGKYTLTATLGAFRGKSRTWSYMLRLQGSVRKQRACE